MTTLESLHSLQDQRQSLILRCEVDQPESATAEVVHTKSFSIPSHRSQEFALRPPYHVLVSQTASMFTGLS